MELDDVLAADYSYWILLVELIRKITPKAFQHNLNVILEDESDAICYTMKRASLLKKFEEELPAQGETESKTAENMQSQKGGKGFTCIDRILFKKVRAFHEEEAMKELKKQLEQIRKPEFDKKKIKAALLGWVIHFERNDEITGMVKHWCSEWKDILNIDTKEHRYTDMKKAFFEQYETLKIVDDVIIPEKATSLKGKMKIVRVTSIEKGNRFYSTLCLARHIASKNNYMFEVIRDFGNFRLKDFDVKKCDDALFRVRRVLQTKQCQHRDPNTFEPCQQKCKKYEPKESDLVCRNCNHMHKQVKLYKDLKHLPVLLILQRRGRLGDTFPESFNCMDLRLCYRDQVSFY